MTSSMLYIFYENQLVGTLSRDEDLVYSFIYEDSWIASPQRFPLSLAMPLTQKRFGNRVTLSFFENLLPEGELREKLEKDHDIHGTFDFLKEFGQDSAGAIIITSDKKFDYKFSESELVQVDIENIYSAIRKRKSVADVIAGMNPGYLSLAGAQDKFPAVFKDRQFYLPTRGGPTTHIVKTPIQREGIKESVYNEYFCMELARRVGFRIPSCEIMEGEYPLFIIERYDRFSDSKGQVHRIHQQDFCQAQGITSEFKYEAKGGPSFKANYEVILNNISITKRMQNLEELMNWLCFNLLIGNNDSHSKNISILLKNGKNELAPFYDLLSTVMYDSLKKQFSFKIGDKDKFSEIGINQFHLLEKELGVKENTLVQRMRQVRDRVMEAKEEVVSEVLAQYPKAKISRRISELVEKRSKGLRQQGLL